MKYALCMGVFQSAGDLDSELQGFLHRQRARERLTVHVLHHQVVRTHIVNLANVRVVQRRDGAGLLFEAGGVLFLRVGCRGPSRPRPYLRGLWAQ